jgi:hypothetical protein
MMQSYTLRLLSRSALCSILVGSIFPGFYSAQGTAIAAQPENASPNALANVKSNHWTFRSLKSLAQRYGCVINPSGIFFSPTATPSRYEMAAALNACLDQIEVSSLNREDQATAQALLKEFKGEMAVLRSKVSQDCRTTTLESQQFSISTRTHGEVVFFTPSSSDLTLKPHTKSLATQKSTLTTLKGRVDSLNKETQKLEFNQFSTTTKLQGQAIITIQGGGFR